MKSTNSAAVQREFTQELELPVEVSRLRACQAGFGLIEIMIATSIGLFMLLGIVTLVVWVSQARVELDKTSEQIENGRYAIQLFRDNIQMAGFYGVPRVAADVYTAPLPCAESLTDIQFGYTGAQNQLPLPIYGYIAGSTLPGAPGTSGTCLSSAVADSEALVIHRVGTTPVLASSIGTGAGPHVQISSCSSDTQILKVANTSAAFTTAPLLRQKDCATTSTSAWPYTSQTYFLTQSGGVPTLSVAELVGGSVKVTPLVEGIEDMHITYGLDFDADGAPDCFAADPGASSAPTGCPASWSAVALNNWANVTAVRVSLLARSISTTPGWSDTRTYDLGRASRSGPFNDGFKRQVYSAVVALPNVGGVRE
jgi:type IV pilus assembly protein PilW